MMIKSITAVAVGIAITTGLTLPVVAQTEADAMVFVRLVNRQLGSDNRYTKLVSNSGKVEDAMLFCKRLDEGYTGYILAQEILKKNTKN